MLYNLYNNNNGSIENTSENTNVETSKNIRKFIYVDTNCNFPPIIYQVRFKIK